MKSSLIKENKNFYWSKEGFLYHFSGEPVGEPHYRFKKITDEERRKYICHEKSIQVTPHGVLVEYDSNCFDVEDAESGYNRDDDGIETSASPSEMTGCYSYHSSPDKRRHYINKMFYNNNNELVFEQNDYERFGTITGEELLHLCDSTVTLTDKGIAVMRRSIAKEFTRITNPIGGFNGSGKDIRIDNSRNAKEAEFFTYEELNRNYKQKEAMRKEYYKILQEDHDWTVRNEERLHKFGFNNITLKTPQGQATYQKYKAWQDAVRDSADGITF